MPVLQAHPHAHSVVVQDNFVTHHDEEFKGLVETAGAIWIHTPPYSPDMNPIELVFAQVKAYLRRHGPRLLLGDPATGIDEALVSKDLSPVWMLTRSARFHPFACTALSAATKL